MSRFHYFTPRCAGKSILLQKLGAIKHAVRAGIPVEVIRWRIDHNWPLDKLAATSLEDL